MKNSIAIIALFSLFSLSAQAQTTATWKGGTPGRSTDWNCPTNWKEGRVPNEFSKVIIPDVSTSTFSYPLIQKGTVEVYSLECASTAKLTFKGNARIIVLDSPEKRPAHSDEDLALRKHPHDSLTTDRN